MRAPSASVTDPRRASPKPCRAKLHSGGASLTARHREKPDSTRKAEVHPTIAAGRIRHRRHNYRLLPQFAGTKAVGPLLIPPEG